MPSLFTFGLRARKVMSGGTMLRKLGLYFSRQERKAAGSNLINIEYMSGFSTFLLKLGDSHYHS